MNTFTLSLYDATTQRRIEHVACFVGEDSSGSFGLKAHHARFMTILVVGLARFRLAEDDWQYLALPGGVLYFNRNILSISTRHFLIDRDYEHISELLKQELQSEEQNLHRTRASLQQMEQAMLTRLWKLKHLHD